MALTNAIALPVRRPLPQTNAEGRERSAVDDNEVLIGTAPPLTSRTMPSPPDISASHGLTRGRRRGEAGRRLHRHLARTAMRDGYTVSARERCASHGSATAPAGGFPSIPKTGPADLRRLIPTGPAISGIPTRVPACPDGLDPCMSTDPAIRGIPVRCARFGHHAVSRERAGCGPEVCLQSHSDRHHR